MSNSYKGQPASTLDGLSASAGTAPVEATDVPMGLLTVLLAL